MEISKFGLYILFIRQKVRGAMGMQKMCNFQIVGAMDPKIWLNYNFISITVIWGQIILKVFEKKIVCTCDDVETSISNKNNNHLEQFIYYPFLDLRNGTLIKVKIQFWPFSLAYSIKSIIFFNFMYKDDHYYFLINNNM